MGIESMMTRQEVDGRSATLNYLTDALEPAEEAAATLVKVTFDDDNSSIFIKPNKASA